MGLGLTQKLEHKLEQKLNTEQRLALRQEMLQSLSQDVRAVIDNVRSDSEEAPGAYIATQVEQALNNAAAALPEEARGILLDEGFRGLIIETIHSNPTEIINGQYTEAATDKLSRIFSGEQVIEKTNPDGTPGTPDRMIVEGGTLRQILSNRSAAEQHVTVVEGLLKSATDQKDVRIKAEELTRYRNAFLVADNVSPLIEGLENVLPLVAQTATSEEGTTLKDELIDNMFIERLLKEGILSDRIVKKMNTTLTAELGTSTTRKFKKDGRIPERKKQTMITAVSNGLASSVLIGLGVVERELFQVKKAQSIDFQQPIVRENFRHDTGVDPIELLKRHNLENKSEFFYSRYATKGVEPTTATDNHLRDFITGPARDAAMKALEAADIEGKLLTLFQERVAATEKPTTKQSEDEDLHMQTGQFIKDLFADDRLIQSIRQDIKTSLSAHLTGLMTAA